MSIPSQTDFVPGLDPTGRTTISGAQLYEMVSGLAAYADKGLVIVTTDNPDTTPNVPDANTTTKWKRCVWLRTTATLVIPYVWSPYVNDAVYLGWVTIAQSSLIVTNSMIQDNTITAAKIASVNGSAIIGSLSASASTGLISTSTAATGDLAGSTFGTPVIAASAITTSKINANAVTHDKLGAQAVQVPTDILPAATGLAKLRTNAGATACEWTAHDVVQIVQSALAVKVNSVGNVASLTAIPNANTTGITDSTLSQAITPVSAASTLYIDVVVPVGINDIGAVFVGLFTANSGASAAVAGGAMYNGSAGKVLGDTVTIRYSVASASTTPRTYYIMFGATGAAAGYINSIDGTNVLFGLAKATIRIIEYI